MPYPASREREWATGVCRFLEAGEVGGKGEGRFLAGQEGQHRTRCMYVCCGPRPEMTLSQVLYTYTSPFSSYLCNANVDYHWFIGEEIE